MKVLFIMDALASLHLEGDTTYAFLLAAERLGWSSYTCQVGHLGLNGQQALAQAWPTKAVEAKDPADAFSVGVPSHFPLSDFDAVFLRTDPPVNAEYLQATWILEHARDQTVLVNDPRGLRELNEHLSALRFPEITPKTIVTRDMGQLRQFLADQNGVMVVKPVDGFGGKGIFIVRQGDPNLSSLLETATDAGRTWTMAQAFLPDASVGDKRILLADGEYVGAILRIPPPGEARDNLHVGGRAEASELTKKERDIVQKLAPTLRQHGILFAGIDVIGEQLTEINITSPTGIRHFDRLTGGDSAGAVLASVAKRAQARA